MAGVVYGSSMADKVLRIFRVKSDHTQILNPVSVDNAEITDISDAELATTIFGDVAINAQDDGSNQIQFVVADYSEAIMDFIDQYKNVAAAGDKTAFVTAHGESYGGNSDTGSDDALLLVIHGSPDPNTNKVMVYTFLCTLDVAGTGSFGIKASETTQIQMTFNQIKPKVDLVYHTGTGSVPSVLNGAVVDFATETTDLVLLEGKYKYHRAVTAA